MGKEPGGGVNRYWRRHKGWMIIYVKTAENQENQESNRSTKQHHEMPLDDLLTPAASLRPNLWVKQDMMLLSLVS